MSGMMRTIGFLGGHSVYEIGPPDEIEAFFACLNALAPGMQAKVDLLTDRLCRRYLSFEQLDDSAQAMASAEVQFAATGTSSADWAKWGVLADVARRLALRGDCLAAVFERVFARFGDAVASARSFREQFGIYQALRIVIADMPEFMIDKKRALTQYDALQGPPLWLR
jgi:hypothetical protein